MHIRKPLASTHLAAQVGAPQTEAVSLPLEPATSEVGRLVVTAIQVPPALSGSCRWTVLLAGSVSGRNNELVGFELADTDDADAEARLIRNCLKHRQSLGTPERITLDNAPAFASFRHAVADLGITLVFRPTWPNGRLDHLGSRLMRKMAGFAATTSSPKRKNEVRALVRDLLVQIVGSEHSAPNGDRS